MGRSAGIGRLLSPWFCCRGFRAGRIWRRLVPGEAVAGEMDWLSLVLLFLVFLALRRNILLFAATRFAT